MTAMFPDSGVPAKDAKNSLLDPSTQNCQELWYATTRCAPRFDPAAANAMLAEMLNIINKGEVVYDCTKLDQLSLAVQYLIQRGIPSGTVGYYGPFDYAMFLDPPATRYSDMMVLLMIPQVNNQGAVRINVNGLGWRDLVRNDGMPLEARDLLTPIPALIAYWGGRFYMLGLCASQVPLLVKGVLDIWIRTDGNDETGDGSANTPQKAFRTIAGAWFKVGNRYAASPLFTMRLRLGIPGDYTGTFLGPFGGSTILMGDAANRGGYRIVSFPAGAAATIWASMITSGINIEFIGLTFCRTAPLGVVSDGLRCHGGSNVVLTAVDIETTFGNPSGSFVINAGGNIQSRGGVMNINGKGLDVGDGFFVLNAGVGPGGSVDPAGCRYNFNQCKFSGGALSLRSLGSIFWGGGSVVDSGCTGRKYFVTENSILNMAGQPVPGDVAGVTATGGQFIP